MRGVLLLLALGVVASGVSFLFSDTLGGVEGNELASERELFVISLNESREEIARRLEDEGYLIHSSLLRPLQLLMGVDSEISPGGYALSHEMSMREVVQVLQEPSSLWVTLQKGLSRQEIAERIGEVLEWDETAKRRFITASAAIGWDALHQALITLFADEFLWKDTEKSVFATMGAFFSDPEYDFLEHVYVPGDYLFDRSLSRAQIADLLLSRYLEEYEKTLLFQLSQDLSREKAHNVRELVRGEVEFLPDLVPLAPQDVLLREENGKKILVFSTTYWNQGRGPFELVADPKTRGSDGDVERSVFQRIYRVDGDYRDRLVGTFLWHDEHLHYHFSDFIIYELVGVGSDVITSTTTRAKRTYCVRDVDVVDTGYEGASDTPAYRICGKERQGVSIGWGDSYYYTYADQNLDITELAPGMYTLRFLVNPRERFEEVSYDNNESSASIFIDSRKGEVRVIELDEH